MKRDVRRRPVFAHIPLLFISLTFIHICTDFRKYFLTIPPAGFAYDLQGFATGIFFHWFS